MRKAVLLLCIVAPAAFAASREYTLIDQATATVTSRVFEDGPGFRLVVAFGRPTIEIEEDALAAYVDLGVGALEEFLADERWCMDGFNVGEPRLMQRGVIIDGKCRPSLPAQ